VFDAAQALFERAGHGGRNTATQQPLRTAIGHDVGRNFAGEASQVREKGQSA